ncbi:hypothetical protein [Actinomycetospora sp. NBC_00405]|uniref:hypothetical protein n=1 Tax=Actinomycetospora sp. NBC_00405 TaxID=2975952 RepID=UPI002E246586
MAKNKPDDKSTSTTVVPTVRPDDPPPSAASPSPTKRPTGPGENVPARSAPSSSGRAAGDVVAQLGDVATASIRVTKRLLPGRTPAYLGAGALLVAGIIEPPALLAGGLAYEALRRWNPPST